ncbi:hybrid sensor histidine kinase/response regulator transcription factor [Mangrovibacterium marinum]|uniref:hybrid sensor histidine kinase/response regulator transcription factor n=1 Tax=Mangrovibacterium marinum TaxID=1639118 RepID=UPI000D3017F0|nr:hybrid sensor histidine kinase/response regulator transcription factor [Mangrovibacterium marinum]
MSQKIRLLLLLISLCLSSVYGQKSKYRTFANINLGPGVSVVSCFSQDSQGLVWIGASKGLFSYDGYSVQPHFTINEKSNTQIYCGAFVSPQLLYLGADNGVLIYNIQTDRYEDAPVEFPTDVRSMALQGDTLWLGSLQGLFGYSLRDQKLISFGTDRYPSIPHKTVYSVIPGHDKRVYVGTYDGLCYYDPKQNDFQQIQLPQNPKRNNQFINALLEDSVRGCIWVGMEGGLLRYNLKDGGVEPQAEFQDNSVKSLALDANGYLLAGTDNGLFVYTENEELQHLMHDSRNPNSLFNNIVWNIYTDGNQNVWLGTDSGVSLARTNRALQEVPIAEITGVGDGNRFYSLFKDSRNYYWFGGSNGIIRVNQSRGEWTDPVWYNTEDARHPLAHGRIRHIYEDRDSDLWIATDGSINRYDYRAEQFIQYNIVDNTGRLNSNWAYNLFEDNQGNLWVATCLGGIFVVDKQKLLSSKGGSYVADYNFNTGNGLSGMFINQIVPDKQGNVWVLLYKNGIDKIDTQTRKVTKFPLDKYTRDANPSFILPDHSGRIWLGLREGVLVINPENDQVDQVFFDTSRTNEVLSMMEADGTIWVSTTDGFWLVDTESLQARYLNLSDKRFLSLFYDPADQRILMGEADGIAITTPAINSMPKKERPIIATGFYVNSEPFEAEEASIRYNGHISLNYQQNNIAVDISDLPYSMEEKSKLVYRLDDLDADWNLLNSDNYRISYSNLDHGDYRLRVTRLDANGKPSANPYTLNITINPPWYFTWWAKSSYAIVVLALVGWIINFFRVRNRLRIERIEKAKISEQSRMKMEFLSNMSHELKTPLSMIIAPISRLLSEIKNSHEKQQLKQVQQNAIKLNSLIHQMLDFNRIDVDKNSLLILSRIELVGFARKLFNVFAAAEDPAEFTFQFSTNKDRIDLELDVIKWESILSNLFSNAVKYSSGGGVISLSINYNDADEILELSVSDTGTGIPAKDLPYIFQRFFQSSKTAGKKEGTGIGLYLVKTYTELHGGKVTVVSEENVGTTFTVRLPIQAFSAENPAFETESGEVSLNNHKADKPVVLIVDDNREIAGFVRQLLQPQYNCLSADDGENGLALCLEHQPNLVISDVMMPGIGGLEMCRRIRKNMPTSTTPIILLTAKDDKETELESIHLNIDAFIPKPFEPDILLSRVEQLIQKKQKLESKIRLETIAEPREIEAESQDEKFLSRITNIVEEHLADSTLNVNALCEISGVNNKQIYRKMKQLTGMTPVEYIRSVRMKKAAMLLRQQKFSVAEVMYMVGFSNHSYFSKCFKAEFNKTPMQYKEES